MSVVDDNWAPERDVRSVWSGRCSERAFAASLRFFYFWSCQFFREIFKNSIFFKFTWFLNDNTQFYSEFYRNSKFPGYRTAGFAKTDVHDFRRRPHSQNCHEQPSNLRSHRADDSALGVENPQGKDPVSGREIQKILDFHWKFVRNHEISLVFNEFRVKIRWKSEFLLK